jgi:hypothetical protein
MEKKKFTSKSIPEVVYEVVGEKWMDKNTYLICFQTMTDVDGDDFHLEMEYHKDTNEIIYTRCYDHEVMEGTQYVSPCFKKQMEEYRNSLIIYEYESQLINQKLDTVVSEDEIAEYYEQNKEDFQLRNTMVRVAYVILNEDEDKDNKQKATFQKLLSDPDTLLLQNIDILANYYAVKSYVDVDQWMRLDDLTNIIPIEIFNAESFLKKNKFVCFDMNEYTYMVRFVDYLLEESTSPLEMVSDNIKSVILARRKQEMLEKMKTSLYEKAKRDRAFEVYVGSPTLYNAD